MAETLTADSVIRRSENFPVTKLDDAVIAIDRTGGFCYALNTTGAMIWESLIEPKQISAVCEEMCGRFAVDPATCLEDIVAVVSDMQRAGLLR